MDRRVGHYFIPGEGPGARQRLASLTSSDPCPLSSPLASTRLMLLELVSLPSPGEADSCGGPDARPGGAARGQGRAGMDGWESWTVLDPPGSIFLPVDQSIFIGGRSSCASAS